MPVVRPRPGLVITRSVRIAPGTWRLTAPTSLDSALITITGEGITVDFTGARLVGAAPDAPPDQDHGVAIRVEGGRAVRIVGATVRGYRIGLLARGTHGLDIAGGDFSYNWKPRLFSLVEHESLADWLSFHHDEHEEWLRFGAGLLLEDVHGGTLRGVTALQGMNGALLVRSDSVDITDGDFSFNSGLGIGLYRSSANRIVHNRVDYDVRGFSYGFYHRGQDSAGLLLYEQSSGNVVAYNSFTHGGDGIFLWAGQSTMDSGTGGANDNVFYGNDASFSPANGIEATFSRNVMAANLLEGDDYGIWGGYSYASRIVGNRFAHNRTGIAIEHGQDNDIAANRFDGDTTAVSLWADPIEPSDWGYPKVRDTRSRDTRVRDNQFIGNRVALRVRESSGVSLTGSRATGVDSLLAIRDSTVVATADNATVPQPPALPRPPTDAAVAPPTASDTAVPATDLSRRPRSAIIVDEWGPYDYRSPKLWPADSSRAVPLRLAVLGPPGRWRLASARGVAGVRPTSGRVGDTLVVTPAQGPGADWAVHLVYTGAATVSPRGVRGAAGRPYPFVFARVEPAQDWDVRFFSWGDSTDVRTDTAAFAALLRGAPVFARREPRLDYMWYRPPAAYRSVPAERFAIEASARVTLPPGRYTLRTISDDGIRVWIDGRLAIDDWSAHESTVDHANLTGGRHDVVVRYFQVDGWMELRLDFVRGDERSTGSPGPH